MVPLILRQEFSGPGLGHPRERGMYAGHPRVGAAPPAECEERRGDRPTMRGPAARVYLKIVRSTSRRKRLRPMGAYIRPGGRVMSRNRVKTYVRGFDDVLNGGIPEGYVVLVSGAPGTMKSSLTYSILYQNALQESRKSAYFTLEQGKDLILEHMASMGMADPRAAEQIVTLDMGNIRKNLSYLQGRGTC